MRQVEHWQRNMQYKLGGSHNLFNFIAVPGVFHSDCIVAVLYTRTHTRTCIESRPRMRGTDRQTDIYSYLLYFSQSPPCFRCTTLYIIDRNSNSWVCYKGYINFVQLKIIFKTAKRFLPTKFKYKNKNYWRCS